MEEMPGFVLLRTFFASVLPEICPVCEVFAAYCADNTSQLHLAALHLRIFAIMRIEIYRQVQEVHREKVTKFTSLMRAHDFCKRAYADLFCIGAVHLVKCWHIRQLFPELSPFTRRISHCVENIVCLRALSRVDESYIDQPDRLRCVLCWSQGRSDVGCNAGKSKL